MRRDVIDLDGRLWLGDRLEPGTVVCVVVLSTGSVLLTRDDEPPLELRARPADHTPIAGSRLALNGARQDRNARCTMASLQGQCEQ